MTTKSIHKSSAVADCRPKGGNGSRCTRQPTTYLKVLQSTLKDQWWHSKPKWFITLQWTPAAVNYETASGHSRLFRNKLLTTIYNCRLKDLPEPQDRCRLIWFHERAEDPSGRLIYHSHLHLTPLPKSYSTQRQLELLIQHQVAPGFRCLKNLFRKRDPAVVVVPWIQEHHANYNLKDYYTYKHHQDPDLVFDPEISDLIFTK
jgi:hypothetical protein